MNETDYTALIRRNAYFWGAVGPWRGEKGNFRFTTRSGHAAAVRRDAEDGFLYGCVSITNPDHPALKFDWGKDAAQVGAFDRPAVKYPPTIISPPILDLPTLSQGSWFMFSCGYEGKNDLIPRWAHRDYNTYRDAKYVMEQCEALSDIFAAMWNEYLLQRGRTSPVGTKTVDQTPIGGVKQPQPSLAELSALMDQGFFIPDRRPGDPGAFWNQPSHRYRYPVAPGKNLDGTPVKTQPKCKFLIEGWKTDTTSVKHEIKAVSDDSCRITITGRNGKILAQFVVKEAK